LNDDPAANLVDFTGLLAGDYDGSGTVDNWDYMSWKQTFAEVDDGLLTDGNGNGQVDIADYVIWRKHLGESVPAAARGVGTLSEDATSYSGVAPDAGVTTDAVGETSKKAAASSSIRRTSHIADPSSTSGLLKSRKANLESRLASIAAVSSRTVDLLLLDSATAAIERKGTLAISDLGIDKLFESESEQEELAWNTAFESFERHAAQIDL
jgi:hypothetical protein